MVDSVVKRQRRGHGRPTLHHVAELAGVTSMTVSRWMRDPTVVAPETGTRIREAVAAVGYVPNLQAGQLAAGHSRLVAALVPSVGHSVFAESVQGLSEGLHDSGHELLLMTTGYSLQREEDQLRALLAWSPCALIITGRRHRAGLMQLLESAIAAGTPVLEIWDYAAQSTKAPTIPAVGFDHRAVGGVMASHLIGLGHRHLAYVQSGVSDDYRARERQLGFSAKARRHNVDVRTLRASLGDPFEAGRQALDDVLRLPQVSAVAFANDQLATGALLAAQTLGVPVPEQLSLLGFGDFPISRHLIPSLSTVHTPNMEIGRRAAHAVLESIHSGQPIAGEAIACNLVLRDSTARRH